MQESEERPTEATQTAGEWSSLLERQNALLSAPGYRVRALLDRVNRISNLLQGNMADYQALVARLQDPQFALPILDVRQSNLHDDLLSDAERLLLNVLNGISSRTNQQRAFMRRYFKADHPDLFRQYTEKIRENFATSLPAKFLKTLRNEIEHVLLPVAQSSQAVANNMLIITFVLPTPPLLAWKCWSEDERRWISDQGASVRIVDVVAQYTQKAAAFDAWLFGSIAQLHARELAEFEQMRHAYNRDYQSFGL